MNHYAKDKTWVNILSGAAFLISITALVLAYAKLDVPLKDLQSSYNNAVTIVEMVIGILGLCVTIYFVTMGITLHKYTKSLEETLSRAMEMDTTMQFQFKEIINVISDIETVSGDKAKYIRLARGRLICRSKYSNDAEKKDGISAIQGYYTSKGSGRSAIDEDIQILKNLTNDFKIDKDVRENAQRAIDAIEGKDTQQKEEDKKSNLILTKMQQLIDKIEGLVTEKSGGQKRKNKAKS